LKDGIFKRPLEVSEREEKVVAVACNCNFAAFWSPHNS
jgi:hypothetical protein